MKIHAEIINDNSRVILVETAGSSGGRKHGNFRMLRTVRLPKGAEYKGICATPGAEEIESWEVDARSTGPRSNYARTLAAMQKELAGHAQNAAPILYMNPHTGSVDTLENWAAECSAEDLKTLVLVGGDGTGWFIHAE